MFYEFFPLNNEFLDSVGLNNTEKMKCRNNFLSEIAEKKYKKRGK